MFNPNPAGAPVIFPFLFITIACGAISGFHCLVSSGTSSKQLDKEPDAPIRRLRVDADRGLPGGVGDPRLRGGARARGPSRRRRRHLLGADAWSARYGSWGVAGGLAQTVAAFVDGSANFLIAMGIPAGVGIALMGVLVASFAGTTLDTACRLQRYVIQELAAARCCSSLCRGGTGRGPPVPPRAGPALGQPDLLAGQQAWGDAVRASSSPASLPPSPAPGSAWTWTDRRHRRDDPLAALRGDQPASRRALVPGDLRVSMAAPAADVVPGRSPRLHADPARVGHALSGLHSGPGQGRRAGWRIATGCCWVRADDDRAWRRG